MSTTNKYDVHINGIEVNGFSEIDYSKVKLPSSYIPDEDKRAERIKWSHIISQKEVDTFNAVVYKALEWFKCPENWGEKKRCAHCWLRFDVNDPDGWCMKDRCIKNGERGYFTIHEFPIVNNS